MAFRYLNAKLSKKIFLFVTSGIIIRKLHIKICLFLIKIYQTFQIKTHCFITIFNYI